MSKDEAKRIVEKNPDIRYKIDKKESMKKALEETGERIERLTNELISILYLEPNKMYSWDELWNIVKNNLEKVRNALIKEGYSWAWTSLEESLIVETLDYVTNAMDNYFMIKP